jgi:LysR family hydrogen peroxide-inducible transcriptional activator
MELNQIRYFVALSHSLNFTRAAEQCNVSQPALTKAIQKLEYELGGELVYRERHLTQLTELGRMVLPMLEQTMAVADAVRAKTKEFRRRGPSSVKIALAPCIPASIALGPLTQLAKTMPGLEIELLEASDAEIAHQLLAGDFSAALAGDPIEPLPERIDHWTLFDEPMLVVGAPNSELAKYPEVPLSCLAKQNWLARPQCPETLKIYQLAGGTQEMVPGGYRSTQLSHLQEMVAANLGIMLLPQSMAAGSGLVARPIAGNPLHRQVNLMVVAGRKYSASLDAFIKLARQFDWAGMLEACSPALPQIRRNVRLVSKQRTAAVAAG